jgi:hypothetical protein
MKRVWTGAVAVSALLLALAVPASAQAPPSFTVTFSGEMRVHGFVWDNIIDFQDTAQSPQGCATAVGGNAQCKDSNSFYFQRWRLFTRVESADKKARAVWGLEVGDVTWGNGGGASGGEYGGPGQTAPGATPTGGGNRVGNGSGGGLGNDGINVETKTLYVQFDIPGMQGANLLLGMHNIVLLSSPTLAFLDDDGAGIQFNWKFDPVDLQLYTVKVSENTLQNADDNDMYAARLGFNITKAVRATIEGLVMNNQCFARRAVASPNGQGVGTCLASDFGDTFWVGSTLGFKLGNVTLDGTIVYGQRRLPCVGPGCDSDGTAEESGYGLQLTARVPIGPVSVWAHGWYTSGDENRGPGTVSGLSSGTLTGDSDKLPIVIAGTSWGSAPFVGEYITGLRTLGSPAVQNQGTYLDPSGQYGIGGSGTFAITPALSVGGGLAYIGATEDNGVFGDYAVELDAGLLYTYNSNLSFQFIGAYIEPEQGDGAWALGFRTRFAF